MRRDLPRFEAQHIAVSARAYALFQRSTPEDVSLARSLVLRLRQFEISAIYIVLVGVPICSETHCGLSILSACVSLSIYLSIYLSICV